jgi:hypothetical protein
MLPVQFFKAERDKWKRSWITTCALHNLVRQAILKIDPSPLGRLPNHVRERGWSWFSQHEGASHQRRKGWLGRALRQEVGP